MAKSIFIYVRNSGCYKKKSENGRNNMFKNYLFTLYSAEAKVHYLRKAFVFPEGDGSFHPVFLACC